MHPIDSSPAAVMTRADDSSPLPTVDPLGRVSGITLGGRQGISLGELRWIT
jgi:hypothetical protein